MSVSVHPTALVDSRAQLGVDVHVGAYAIVGPHVTLGDRCKIRPHTVIEGHTSIGDESEVYQFASIGAPPQDLKFHNEPSTLVIGKKNTIREYVTLQPGTEHGTMTTIIGDNNLFMASSHVGHDCRVGNNNVIANSVALAGHVTIKNNVICGGLVAIHQFCRIGDYAMLSGGSMVGFDVPPYCIAQGDRARLRGVNVIGLRRAGFSDQDVKAVRKLYRHLFLTQGRLEAKLSTIPAEYVCSERIQYFLDFLTPSERGIMQARVMGRGDDEAA